MNSKDIEKYQAKFKLARPGELNSILQELIHKLGRKRFPKLLLPSFFEAYHREYPNNYVYSYGLAKVVADTWPLPLAKKLYQLWKRRAEIGIPELAILFGAGADLKIENELTKALEEIYDRFPRPHKEIIVNAMAAKGGKKSLETLKAIYATLKDRINNSTDAKFLNCAEPFSSVIRRAITHISQRLGIK
ncbi:MAG TPA: hypothetical protein VMB22_00120 [Verrucomicrobiae bacterium]|nr:hypothetical protein [Verrucomicrobiae bacterium]